MVVVFIRNSMSETFKIVDSGCPGPSIYILHTTNCKLCQTREGNHEEFFHHENRAFPPALSDGGNLHLGSKSDLLICLEHFYEDQTEAPVAGSIIVDGAAIIQMLKPAAAAAAKKKEKSLLNMPPRFLFHTSPPNFTMHYVWTWFGIDK